MSKPEPIYVRLTHCQEVFGVHRATIYRWAKQGRIKIHKMGDGVSLLKVSEVMAQIEGH